jgi:hypothetical protein
VKCKICPINHYISEYLNENYRSNKGELAQWLEIYWTTYIKGDYEFWATFITEDYYNIGASKEEIQSQQNIDEN